jgi:hypothetical protein
MQVARKRAEQIARNDEVAVELGSRTARSV